MTIRFSYDKKQVLQALRYHFLNRVEIRMMVILVNVFALLSAILFYFRKILPFAMLVSSALWFCMMITVWFLLPSYVYKRAATFRDHFEMEFDNSGFTLGTERGSRRFQWQALIRSMESPQFFYFYFTPQSFFLVPKEAFTEDETAEMRRLLREHVVDGQS